LPFKQNGLVSYYCCAHFIKFGWAALHFAADKNNKECLELLLTNGADVSIKEKVSGCNYIEWHKYNMVGNC